MAIDIREVFFRLEAFGLYDFLLPFLLMFAVVFGILSFIGIFKEQKGLNAVIAIVLGLLAVRYSFFTDFLNEISPRLGVGLVILLALMILIGLFVPSEHIMIIRWVMVGIGFVFCPFIGGFVVWFFFFFCFFFLVGFFFFWGGGGGGGKKKKTPTKKIKGEKKNAIPN